MGRVFSLEPVIATYMAPGARRFQAAWTAGVFLQIRAGETPAVQESFHPP
jgi:hypothetical protein